MQEGSLFSTPSPVFTACRLLDRSHSDWCEMYLIVVLICISLIMSDITLPAKVHLVKAMFFPVVIYGCESWMGRRLSAEELMLLNMLSSLVITFLGMQTSTATMENSVEIP